MRLLSLFSGIGAFEKTLDKLGIPYELVAYCEIDKYASKSYAAIHGVSEKKTLAISQRLMKSSCPRISTCSPTVFRARTSALVERRKAFSMRMVRRHGRDCSLKLCGLSKKPSPVLP